LKIVPHTDAVSHGHSPISIRAGGTVDIAARACVSWAAEIKNSKAVKEENQMAATTDPNELLVIAFPGENRAGDVLKSLQQLNHEHLIHLKNAAVVVRDDKGKIEIKETREFDPKQGALVGALAGGLLGELTSRNLLLGGALGAAGGYVATRIVDSGKIIDLGFKDDYLRAIADTLTPGSSAIVAIVHFDHVDQAMATLKQFSDGRILRQTLPPDVAQQVGTALGH
jgi:uncharacterized membrane protein